MLILKNFTSTVILPKNFNVFSISTGDATSKVIVRRSYQCSLNTKNICSILKKSPTKQQNKLMQWKDGISVVTSRAKPESTLFM